jgi:hypothetical protein
MRSVPNVHDIDAVDGLNLIPHDVRHPGHEHDNATALLPRAQNPPEREAVDVPLALR